MRVASLFSGAGALDRGLEEAGHEVVLLCDSDPGARQVLKNAFPGTLVAEDVASIASLPQDTELLAAGFPCIDVSRAGLRRGLEGESTGLVRHVFRLLRVAKNANRPIPWVLLENVEALLDRHGEQPPVISYVVQQFMDLGYGSWAYRVVSSAGFGLPNRRKRVFIVASMHGDARDVLLSQGGQPCPGSCKSLFDGRACYHCHINDLQERENDRNVTFAVDLGNAMSPPGEDVVPTFTTSNDRMLLLLPDGQSGMLHIEDAERLQGLPEGWTRPCFPIAAPGIAAHRAARAKDADAEAHTARRWDLLGNAVTVHVARWLGERLREPYAIKYHGISCDDRRMDALLASSMALWSPKDGNGGGATTTTDGARNIWSFVSADELQEAVIFPYMKKKNPRQCTDNDGKDARIEEEGNRSNSEDHEQIHRNASLLRRESSSGPSSISHQARSHAVNENGEVHNKNKNKKNNENGDDIDVDIGGDVDAAGIAAMDAAAEVDAIENDGINESTRKSMFQVAMLERIQRGQVANTSRTQQAWDKESWPRCAWWVRGLGAFAAATLSDSPVLTPFQPIGEFVNTIGRPHTQEEASSYIHRLKERGWDISDELLSRLTGKQGFKSSNQSVAEITRLPYLLSDADLVGDIVWSLDPVTSMHWPGEVLDPLSMPPGRSLPDGAVEKLTSEQRRSSIPCKDGTYDPANESAAHRRVLVIYLPLVGASQQWEWQNPADLEPWEMRLAERERSAYQAVRDSKQAKLKDKLKWAIQDAKSSFALKQGKSSQDVERMKRTRAAMAAAGVNLKLRCGRCRTCMTALGGQKRFECLTQRMKAAALAGHAGAQIAACGHAAVGARVSVWWEGDQKGYEGVVCFYDPIGTEHTVAYDDGEVGMHRLWQHDEHIKALNDPRQWGREAVNARARLRAAHEKLQGKQGQQAFTGVHALATTQTAPITEYEIERADRIANIDKIFEATFGFARPTPASGTATKEQPVHQKTGTCDDGNKKKSIAMKSNPTDKNTTTTINTANVSGQKRAFNDIVSTNPHEGDDTTTECQGVSPLPSTSGCLSGDGLATTGTIPQSGDVKPMKKKRGRKSKETIAREAAAAAAEIAAAAAAAVAEQRQVEEQLS